MTNGRHQPRGDGSEREGGAHDAGPGQQREREAVCVPRLLVALALGQVVLLEVVDTDPVERFALEAVPGDGPEVVSIGSARCQAGASRGGAVVRLELVPSIRQLGANVVRLCQGDTGRRQRHQHHDRSRGQRRPPRGPRRRCPASLRQRDECARPREQHGWEQDRASRVVHQGGEGGRALCVDHVQRRARGERHRERARHERGEQSEPAGCDRKEHEQRHREGEHGSAALSEPRERCQQRHRAECQPSHHGGRIARLSRATGTRMRPSATAQRRRSDSRPARTGDCRA